MQQERREIRRCSHRLPSELQHQVQENSSYPFILHAIGHVVPRIFCAVLSTVFEEQHGQLEHSKENNQNDKPGRKKLKSYLQVSERLSRCCSVLFYKVR